MSLVEQALAELPPADQDLIRDQLALLAVAGYGRRDLAPFSDVDLVFLHPPVPTEIVTALIKRLTREIWDIGLSLGQNVASVREMMRLAQEQILPLTGLLERRLLWGNPQLAESLTDRLNRYLAGAGGPRLYAKAIESVAQEQQEYGSTVHLLEPDVKKSAGGLRDIHLLRWIALGLFRTADYLELEEKGLLGKGDAAALDEAREFLLRVRAELHYRAGKADDSLERAGQIYIAKQWGYVDAPPLLAVEQFMRDYFQKTTTIAEISRRFIRGCRPKSNLRSARDFLFSRRIAPGVTLTSEQLVISPELRAQFASSLEKSLELAEWAAEHEVDLDRETIEELRRAFLREGSAEAGPGSPSRAAHARFLALLGRRGPLHRVLRTLHQVGLLERLIPEFEHARCLLQWNPYHKYTVDEHTFVVLELAERLSDADDLLGREYQRIARKDLFRLAILLHDLGKGFERDHSEIGGEIADRVAERFGLDDEARRTLVFLVHRHLLMSHFAYQRDTSDPRVHVELARQVSTLERLRMLFVFTAVDTMGVGPGTFNPWKSDLLHDLYVRTARFLGDETLATNRDDRVAAARSRLLTDAASDERARRFVEELPAGYLAETALDELAAQLLAWQALAPGQVVTLTEYLPATGTVAYTILTHEKITDGIFYKVCGALSAHYLEVLSARIHTLSDGTVIDRFEVVDTHHAGAPTPERCKLVGATIRRVLTGELSVSDVLYHRRSSIFAPKKPLLPRAETRVVLDNDSSDTRTVIDVFTADRAGLLYTLTKGINRLGLSIQYAKIATYAEEVVDVFYVVEADGAKVHSPDRIALIARHLASDIQRLAADPRSMGF